MNTANFGVSYRVELGNKIRGGRAVGNLYLVRRIERFANGCDGNNAVTEADTIERAREIVAMLNAQIAQSYSGLA